MLWYDKNKAASTVTILWILTMGWWASNYVTRKWHSLCENKSGISLSDMSISAGKDLPHSIKISSFKRTGWAIHSTCSKLFSSHSLLLEWSTCKCCSFQAAFHFQYGGPPGRGDPSKAGSVREACQPLDQEILLLSQRQDWLKVYRLLLLRNLMQQVWQSFQHH